MASVAGRSARIVSIRKRGPRSYQVRVAPFPAQTVPTRDAAERLGLDLKLRKVGGAAAPERPTTLGDEIDGFLARLRAAGGLRPRSIEFYEQKAKVWKPLRGMRVSALRRVEVEDFVVARAAEHPRSALDELQFLERVLREARDRGQRVDEAMLGIKPVKHAPGRGRALTVLRAGVVVPGARFAARAPGGTGGCAAGVLVQPDRRHARPRGRTMPIPAELAKNKREHRVYLTQVEVALLREQLMARAPGTPLVFPTVEGGQWNRARFRDRVWVKSAAAAARHDRRESGRAASVFDGSRSTGCGTRRAR